jgi:hypothetical protein
MKLPSPRVAVAALATALLWNLAATAYVRAERIVYTWDYLGWWDRSLFLSFWIFREPMNVVGGIFSSIAQDDYNLLAAAPVSVYMKLYEPGRLGFVLGLVTLYGAGSAAAFALLCGRTAATSSADAPADRGPAASPWLKPETFVPAAIWLFWSLPFVVAMRGFVDLGAIGITYLIWWLYLGLDTASEKINVRRSLSIGLMLALLFLFRRYWAFWVTAFGAVMAADAAWAAWCLWRRHSARWWAPLTVPPLAGVAAAVTVLVLAAPLVVRILVTPYSDIYSAWQWKSSGSALADMQTAISDLLVNDGVLPVVGGLASLVGLIAWPSTRRVGLLLAGQILLTYLNFRRVQAPGIHHHQLWCSGLTAATGLFATIIAGRISRPQSWGLVAGIAALGMLQAAAAVVPAAGPLRFLVLGSEAHLPMVRNDIPELERLAKAIDAAVAARGGTARIYCLASSGLLNNSTLYAYSASLKKPFRSAALLAPVTDVDKRDGFPQELPTADIVVTTDPPQIHLAEADQQVILVPARQLAGGGGIGAAFERLEGVYTLDGGVKAFLYRRTRPVTPEEVGELSAALQRSYPDRPYVFEYQGGGQGQ